MKLKEIVTIRTGLSIRGQIEPVSKMIGDIRLLQMKNVDPIVGVNTSDIIYVKFSGRRQPEFLVKGDTIFVNRGSRFFAVCLDKDIPDLAAAPHFLILRSKNDSVSPEYISWFLNSKKAQRYFRKEAAGTAVTHISKTSLENLPIPLPSLKKQRLIIKTNKLFIKEKILNGKILEKKQLLIEQLLNNTVERK